jgi:hypothetical protein
MRQLLRSAVIIFVLVPGLATLLHAGVVTVTFDFEDVVAGTSTTFPDTVNGLLATFSSSPDAGGFMVASLPGTFQSLSGNVLIDGAPESLMIVFGAPQTAISLNFAAADTQQLDLSAFLLGAPVGGSSATGTVPAGGSFAEGVLGFSSATFDTVVLSSKTPNFAVDNVAVTDPPPGEAAVPEPGSLLLCAGALAALSFVRLRRRFS